LTDFSIPYLTVQALGFATGTALCWVMAALLWKSENLGVARKLSIGMPLVASLWTSGSFVMQIILLAGMSMQSRPFGLAFGTAWTSTFWMPSMWLLMRHKAALRRSRLRTALLLTSFFIAITLTGVLWIVLFTPALRVNVGFVMKLSAYNAISHGILILVYRWNRSSAPARFLLTVVVPLVTMELLIVVALIHFGLSGGTMRALAFISQQSVIPNLIIVASFLAKFRYADVLLKRSLLIILTVIVASTVVWWIRPIPRGIPVVLWSLAGAGVLLVSPVLSYLVNWIVDRGMLRRPEYATFVKSFAEESGRVANKADLFALVERTAREALYVDSVRVVPATDTPTGGAERILVKSPHADLVLLVSPKVGGRRLLKQEMVFLQAIGGEISRRLEALEFERERRGRQLQEERLRHSLTEAELRALRAQVDPHFLFNTLNTIADLITSDPAKAELMTERLADFFRYTLLRTERTLATLGEELQFVQHYLEIEQVRFGNRLRVELSAAPDVRQEMVPALILQPLVENAIRHGLAPKPEGGCISVSASREGQFLKLEVVDDGMGLQSTSRHGSGIGLQNVRERLRALYGDAARMNVDSGSAQGTCVSLLLPGNGH
jgi:two-component system LytT family sensor kinase